MPKPVYFIQGAAIYGVTKLEEGLERTKLVGHASYAKPFFDTEDTYFRDNPYRFQVGKISETVDTNIQYLFFK